MHKSTHSITRTKNHPLKQTKYQQLIELCSHLTDVPRPIWEPILADWLLANLCLQPVTPLKNQLKGFLNHSI